MSAVQLRSEATHEKTNWSCLYPPGLPDRIWHFRYAIALKMNFPGIALSLSVDISINWSWGLWSHIFWQRQPQVSSLLWYSAVCFRMASLLLFRVRNTERCPPCVCQTVVSVVCFWCASLLCFAGHNKFLDSGASSLLVCTEPWCIFNIFLVFTHAVLRERRVLCNGDRFVVGPPPPPPWFWTWKIFGQ